MQTKIFAKSTEDLVHQRLRIGTGLFEIEVLPPFRDLFVKQLDHDMILADHFFYHVHEVERGLDERFHLADVLHEAFCTCRVVRGCGEVRKVPDFGPRPVEHELAFDLEHFSVHFSSFGWLLVPQFGKQSVPPGNGFAREETLAPRARFENEFSAAIVLIGKQKKRRFGVDCAKKIDDPFVHDALRVFEGEGRTIKIVKRHGKKKPMSGSWQSVQEMVFYLEVHNPSLGAPMNYENMTRDQLVQKIEECEAARHELDRARAEAELRESEKRFKDVAMLLPATICEWDGSLKLRYINAIGFQMFQLTKEQFERGIYLFDMISPHDRTRAELDIQNIFNGDFGNAAEYSVKRMDGTPLHILVNSAPIMPERGLRMCIVDITDRVHAEQKLRELEKQAEEARIKLAQQETEKARHEIANLRKEILDRAAFNDMISRSPLMKEIFDILPEVAATPATVLVTGESGTGKELVARSLHGLSGRKDKPFIAINCSALPDSLLESELFGYRAGAFTDAKKDKPGTFSRAHGGTIFLDEIGDITPSMQVKLLRVIQEKTFEPLGATEQVTVDVHIVAATNKDLGELVRKGLFREDLFYRINVLVIKLPPLRDRRCDIPLLCDHFIGRFNSRYNKEIKGVSPEAETMLLAHDFPGNIRELENIIERAFVFCKDPLIGVMHLPQKLRNPSSGATIQSLSHVKDFDELEKLYLQSVLSETGGSKIRAAERLGIHKATLFRKMHKLGM